MSQEVHKDIYILLITFKILLIFCSRSIWCCVQSLKTFLYILFQFYAFLCFVKAFSWGGLGKSEINWKMPHVVNLS